MDSKKDWFTDWFNTPYYHILYKHRNDDDAKIFMKNLTAFLPLEKSSHILDLPCGKGRHAVFLNSLGYKVTGGDLSENSIDFAKQFENNTLNFQVYDMRKPFIKKYNAIFNLFTSFGYFQEDQEDILVLKNFKNGLLKNGWLVIDFLNVEKVKNNLVKEERKTIDNIDFHIKREIKNGFIFKHISFFTEGKQHSYTEQVKFLNLEKMKEYLKSANLQLAHTFGNYELHSFNPTTSDRLILIAK
ncbi:class I SAM-dependent methyltransferase [Tenacibaculum maritimum]|uniref:class I SAM-dependent methyltransferase n=1 Tax=Tenacibaculum maritimum TaxID=107401 RepID=UPI000403081A|nr:class I SAM-dependent methyltransferase [Tenacibaculum maritimum]MCD9584521.1 class I SAM-dependent methyltransferase [Tenacibaculum maritimum]MCD9610563.1 class I SAM-dependent methyltransferase [Tenacibaculum maritimum]MCD9621349.1 class I SAM-dependent methyltransferase [Tenacibaculum maritimum]MCD9627650.1 class I SAM-dependent methyltransferase [Tenacibaculum maritimum]MCD9630987.1 class I SAM-dependent methyltransferase [Tenacibaculum maritimum]